MKIEICIPDKKSYEIALNIFKEYSSFSVVNTSIINANHVVIVSPGNSFGEMNGGVDGIINTMLSGYDSFYRIEDYVKKTIETYFMGELPVGDAIIVDVKNHPKYKYLIYAPTMRVAETVENSINAYLAFRAVLRMICMCNITNISIPLFCTGAGCMKVERACKQMLEAYNTIINKTLISKDWQIYHNHHKKLQSF